MNNNKTIYTCSKCDAQFPKWQGRCPECGAWGTIKESVPTKSRENKKTKIDFDKKNLIDFNTIKSENFSRIKTNIQELDQIFGGGLVQGSINLIGGEPGIGKSTLVLQILKNLEKLNQPLLYISGEESAGQIKLRLDRLNYKPKNLKFLNETKVEEIQAAIESLKPAVAIIDSIQTIYSSEIDSEPGNVSQIRACTVKLLETAKKNNTAVIITGHVTKDGSVAGPKTLEHLVDVVLYLEGDPLHGYRLLKSSKNRFGSTNEIGLFAMTGQGLIEVKDPTKAFLSENQEIVPGSVTSCFMEGTRAFMVEVQALVTPTIFGYPQRKTSGYDLNRLQMISAVLFKRAKVNLNNQDIHLNIVGGLKVTEPAIDLAVALAIISALKNKPVNRETLVIGEVGLGGEVRSVINLKKRIQEAKKLGFKQIIVPEKQPGTIQITKISQLLDLL